jgi:hypothetical protein
MKKIIVYVASGIILMVVWTLSGEMGRLVGKSTVEGYLHRQRRGAIDTVQEATAKELRRQLSMRIKGLSLRVRYHNMW